LAGAVNGSPVSAPCDAIAAEILGSGVSSVTLGSKDTQVWPCALTTPTKRGLGRSGELVSAGSSAASACWQAATYSGEFAASTASLRASSSWLSTASIRRARMLRAITYDDPASTRAITAMPTTTRARRVIVGRSSGGRRGR
jgi:hypothetical protein